MQEIGEDHPERKRGTRKVPAIERAGGGSGASGAHTNTELIRVLIPMLGGPGGLSALPAGIAKALETAREENSGWRPPTAARPAQRNCALGPGLLGLNCGSSDPYRAANPNYQNCSFSAKMRIMSVLCGASSACSCFAEPARDCPN